MGTLQSNKENIMTTKIVYLATTVAFIIFLLLCHDMIDMTHETVLIAILVTLIFRIITSIIIHQQMTEIQELKMYIKVCAWCKCVGVEDKWLSFEQWAELTHGKKTNHSICPKCKAKVEADLASQYS